MRERKSVARMFEEILKVEKGVWWIPLDELACGWYTLCSAKDVGTEDWEQLDQSLRDAYAGEVASWVQHDAGAVLWVGVGTPQLAEYKIDGRAVTGVYFPSEK